jgi:DNA transposition AAA+ family ATPase
MSNCNEFIKIKTVNGIAYINLSNVLSITQNPMGYYIDLVDGISIKADINSDELSRYLEL